MESHRGSVSDKPITRFRGEWRFLSNFYPSPLCADGQRWPTLEHAFQVAKTKDARWRETILTAKTPGEAKRIGRKVPLREDWEDRKLEVMEHLLRIKFRSPALRARLLETGERVLIEGNTWHDTFWGAVLVLRPTPWDDEPVPCWDGENHLGRLLMKIRDELREDAL